MLTPDFAYCHIVTVERWLGRKLSAEAYSSPEIIRCRVNLKRKHMHLQIGQAANEMVAEGVIFMPAGTRIQPADKLTFAGKTYKAISCQPGYWIDGTETHVEVIIR